MEKKGVLYSLVVAFLFLSVTGSALAQEEAKKVEAEVAWVTLDKKKIVLIKDGKHLMDLELTPDLVVDVAGPVKKKGGVGDILSGDKAKITYIEKGDKKVAQTVSVTRRKKKKKKKK